MGTRADFYVGRGIEAEWIGSSAMDGYPEGLCLTLESKHELYKGSPVLMNDTADFPAGGGVVDATTEDEFRERVALYFANRNDVSVPADGWPWPWNNSQATDFAYCFTGGKVEVFCFGHEYTGPDDESWENSPKVEFPDMTSRKAVTFGPRSGLLVIRS